MINYTETPDWDAKVRELTDGRGVDCIVEIGRPGTIAMSLKALAVGGRVSLIGASLSSSGDRARSPIVDRPRHYAWVDLRREPRGFRGDEPGHRAASFAPVIDGTFPFSEAKAAYRHFEGRGHFGKLVITHG